MALWWCYGGDLVLWLRFDTLVVLWQCVGGDDIMLWLGGFGGAVGEFWVKIGQ